MILFAPFAASGPALNGKPSPKNYPWPQELATLLENENEVIQVGGNSDEQVCKDFRKNLGFREVCRLVEESETGVCVDSFLQHCYWFLGKRAIVLWGISNPDIFGHSGNLNLLVDRRFLRPNQFDLYYSNQYNPEAFVKPPEVLRALCELDPK